MQAIKSPSKISPLYNELIKWVREEKLFKDRVYGCYNLDDLKARASFAGNAVAGVAYEGYTVFENQARPISDGAHAASLATISFAVLLGFEHRASDTIDPKPAIMDTLDSLRERLIGAAKANNRPWDFAGEAVIGMDDSAVWYAQQWQTDIRLIGRSVRSM